MAVADVASGRFEIGRVATRTFEVIRGNFVSFFILGFIATLPTSVYTVAVAMGALPGTEQVASDPRAATLVVAGVFGSLIVGAFFGLVLQATLTYGAISYLSNQPVALGRALGIGLRQFFPLLGIAILEGFGLMGGFLLLVFPGVMLYVMWAVVVPVRVAENARILDAFSRSRALTAGYRWPIFGVIFIFFLGAGVAQNVAQTLVSPVAASGNPAVLYIGAALSALINAIVAVASATLIASIYYELRFIKEGVGPEQIAAVFD
jgi:hypothetical protein